MRVSIFALAFAACLAVPAAAQTEAADATQSPPLAPRIARYLARLRPKLGLIVAPTTRSTRSAGAEEALCA